MHLLSAKSAPLDSNTAVDLGQTGADMVFLSSADSELSLLSRVYARLPDPKPSLRLANLLHLAHPFSVDRYLEQVVTHASLVVVRLLGGVSYWPYGVEKLSAVARRDNRILALVPGHDEEDPDLARLSTCPLAVWRRLWGYFVHGGTANANSFFRYGFHLLAESPLSSPASHPSSGAVDRAAAFIARGGSSWGEPQPFLPAGIYWPGRSGPMATIDDCRRGWRRYRHDKGARRRMSMVVKTAPAAATAALNPIPNPTLAQGRKAPALNPTLAPIPNQGRKASTVVLIFYRALVLSGETAPIDGLIKACCRQGMECLPLYVSSLKDGRALAIVRRLLSDMPPDVIINATGFSLAVPGGTRANQGIGHADREKTEKGEAGGGTQSNPSGASFFDDYDCPVLQALSSSMDQSRWRASAHGLDKRDLAMHVALPEVDGRLITRVTSFRARPRYDPRTQAHIVSYASCRGRADYVAALARAFIRLRQTPPPRRRIAIILANYPNRDGRIGNGVGLDTPESLQVILQALAKKGYGTGPVPQSGDAIIRKILDGPTHALGDIAKRSGNDSPSGYIDKDQRKDLKKTLKKKGARCSLALYRRFFSSLPASLRKNVSQRWGDMSKDPYFDGSGFILPVVFFDRVVVALQPPRGYHLDPEKTYHDPYLPPPHAYLAFYAWLRKGWDAHAFVHLGKHGNLEWLPGKSVALGRDCFPEAALGPMPNIYPFIVNDPGEGSQAKRRAQATIIDHLTPPMTKAGSYGALAEIEALSDEYFMAVTCDPRRVPILRREIIALAADMGLATDCGLETMNDEEDEERAINVLDSHLCELKEMQIRDGLHIFGKEPPKSTMTSFLMALDAGNAPPLNAPLNAPPDAGDAPASSRSSSRSPSHSPPGSPPYSPPGSPPHSPNDNRRDAALDQPVGDDGATNSDTSLLAALAKDVGLIGFDPYGCDLAAHWDGPRPSVLADIDDRPWRNYADTVERLHILAGRLIDGDIDVDRRWSETQKALAGVDNVLRPLLRLSARREIDALLSGLDGRFVRPGPSGAPTRGRIDVLPTGRNFYSVDTRAVPTTTAWKLGWESAQMLVEDYRRRAGEWPRQMALSAWGTANMRTGGEDIAQALALLGARPQWDKRSRRVVGVEVMPVSLLDRPRVDVTLRISGFFRDAFSSLIDVFARAVHLVAEQQENDDDNPLIAHCRAMEEKMIQSGMDEKMAFQRARFRVFGSRPGTYGTGLQSLIDEGVWKDEGDLAETWLDWGSCGYDANIYGDPQPGLLRDRLRDCDAVIHNQDNREHDILDSDDYYQFEGGMAMAVRHLSGRQPLIYHNDHANGQRLRIRTLEEEIGRIVRGRAANPKWIAGVMRHGYKGAFEIAATVDYLFAFAATAKVVGDHHFDALYRAYLEDEKVHDFIAKYNPAALQEIKDRFAEAIRRGLWRPRSNQAGAMLAAATGPR